MKKSKTFRMNFFSAVKIATAVCLLLIFLISSNMTAYAQMVAGGSMSHSSYAIDAQGNLYAWGQNNYGQLGNGTTVNDSTPVMVAFPPGVTKWVAVTAGDGHALAIGNDGNLYAWGHNNKGQLGNGTTSDTSLPAMVTKPAGVTSWTNINAGSNNSFAIGNDGNLYSWGYNNFGQLGNGSKSDTSLPAMVSLPSGVKATAVSAAANSAIALGNDGNLYSWGRNANGQLGNGTTTDSQTPAAITLPSGVTPVKLSSGAYFNSFLGSDGNIYSFGQGNNGQIGNGTTSPGNVPTPTMANKPSSVTSWKAYACGASFELAIGNNDSLYAWGYGGTGEMGNGTTTGNNPTIIRPNLPAGVVPVGVSAGHNHGFIVDKNSNVYSWGRNLEGQLGINNLKNSPTPVQTVGVGGSGNLILPVELTSFTASVSQNGVLLQWRTATEMNNSGFAVERSSNNKTFSKIGFIKGNGSSTNENSYSFLDKNVSGTLYYRLNQIDFNGSSKYSKVIEVNASQPFTYSLKQNYPNPFNPTTVISYSVPEKSFVSIKVYDVIGNEVASLVNNQVDAGSHNVVFNASSLSSGVYFYTITAGNFIATKKLILLK